MSISRSNSIWRAVSCMARFNPSTIRTTQSYSSTRVSSSSLTLTWTTPLSARRSIMTWRPNWSTTLSSFQPTFWEIVPEDHPHQCVDWSERSRACEVVMQKRFHQPVYLQKRRTGLWSTLEKWSRRHPLPSWTPTILQPRGITQTLHWRVAIYKWSL